MFKGRNLSSLIVSPDPKQGHELQASLDRNLSIPTTMLHSFSEAREAVQKLNVRLAIVDVTSHQDQALRLIQHIKECHPHSICFALAMHDERSTHIQALKHGAQTTISSPLHQEEFSLVISKFFPAQDQTPNAPLSDGHVRDSDGFYGIVGTSPIMKDLFQLITRLGEEGETTVLIQGESGVGKELVAKALHECSPRANKNFVPVNCAAIPDSLLESELFGHEKGAFTGATHNKKGRLHHAHGGTLFLDEIGEMRPALQVKLLRVIQEREFEPIGAVKAVQVDTRIVAATNMDLEQAVQNGSFRNDLYYRLSVVPLHIPPLRDRRDDVPMLLDRFALVYNRGKKGYPKKFSPQAQEILKNYSWPGNVRELKNLVQRLCVLHQGPVINHQDLPEEIRCEGEQNIQEMGEEEQDGTTAEIQNALHEMDQEIDFNNQVSEFEDRLILQALIATNGNKKQAAKRLNLKRTTLLEKIKKKKLERKYFQCDADSPTKEKK
ncbi:MAG: sigma-54 dependent transcriptional regulator [Desulfovermiculus sp.]